MNPGWSEGQRVGRYRLRERLGAGGAGEVWAADLHGPGGLRKPVALKVLHRGAEELRREARLGGLLRHPNLVDVYEVGEVDGRWFCAMERCEGPLSDHLPLPPRAVVEVGLQVCAALSYAHRELGLVHLDLKPSNLLRTAEGAVKVADLGIARADGFDDDGRVRGTLGYMAPEQARGEPVDARADVHALGVTLAELATGTRPGASGTLSFDTGDWDTPADGASGEAPDWLAEVYWRCLEADPADRYPDMDALARALRALPAPGPGLREPLGIPMSALTPSRAGALPGPAESPLGRAEELAALAAHLAAPGVTTLKGPAGVGKTRLAVAAARAFAAAGGGEARFADLSDQAADPSEARAALEEAIGLWRTLGDPVGEQVAREALERLSGGAPRPG